MKKAKSKLLQMASYMKNNMQTIRMLLGKDQSLTVPSELTDLVFSLLKVSWTLFDQVKHQQD